MSTDWEEHYRRGETPWDKGEASPALREALQRVPMAGRVAVPGCGLGHDVRTLALHPGVTEVVGLDLSPTAVAAARALPPAAGEQYLEHDLFSPAPPPGERFDWVWEHTCFCAIPPARRADYVQGVARLLKPGGQLLGVFYLDPGQRLSSDGPPFESRLGEILALFGAEFQLQAGWLPSATYPGRAGREWVCWFQRTSGGLL